MDKTLFTEKYQTFLSLLKELRINANLTQGDVAEALDETQSFISKCERGERRIDVIELRQFCQVIGISLPEFSQLLEEALKQEEGSNA